ncbi:MAG: DoxX family protein [Dehalococcoidia bacterium]
MRTVNLSQSGAVTSETQTSPAKPRKYGALLWTVQGMLAVVFLFAGSMKLVMPAQELTKQISLSVTLLRFIGVCEVLGALGLVLPGLSRIRTELTPLAATGLVVIMIGAVVVTVATTGVAPALMPMVVGCLAVFVAYGRSRLAPIQGKSRRYLFAARSVAGGVGSEAL